MRWSYFKSVRGIDLKSYFLKRNLDTRQKIKQFLETRNFTYSQNELNIIYDTVIPKKKEAPKKQGVKKQNVKKPNRKKTLLPQKKKRVRNSNQRKRYVSGSLDK